MIKYILFRSYKAIIIIKNYLKYKKQIDINCIILIDKVKLND